LLRSQLNSIVAQCATPSRDQQDDQEGKPEDEIGHTEPASNAVVTPGLGRIHRDWGCVRYSHTRLIIAQSTRISEAVSKPPGEKLSPFNKHNIVEMRACRSRDAIIANYVLAFTKASPKLRISFVRSGEAASA